MEIHSCGDERLNTLKITLADPQDNKDTLELDFVAEDTVIGKRWFNMATQCLEDNLQFEKNFCWLSWPDPDRDLEFLRKKLNRCVDLLNKHGQENPKWNGYTIHEKWNDILEYDALNQLHHHFEILMGQVWDISPYMITADDETKYQIRQLNNLVHETQSRLAVNELPLEILPAMTVVSYLNIHRELFDDSYYDSFDINRNFGDIFLHYTQTGKTPMEAFTDDDDHVGDENINALRYISGEYNLWWGRSYTEEQVAERKSSLRKWLNKRDLIKSEHPDFNYYVDERGDKQGVGWVRVGRLTTPYNTREELMRKMLTRLNIVKLQTFTDDELQAENTWDYSWADQDYEQKQIELLRPHFPRE